jgi:hypothetical protein
MKALSIRQPWINAILHAGKCVENRTWANQTVRGTWVALHASARRAPPASCDECMALARRVGAPLDDVDEPMGAVLGIAFVEDIIFGEDGPLDVGLAERVGPWFEGGVGFVFGPILHIPEQIPCRGALNFWTVPDEVDARMKEMFPRFPPADLLLHPEHASAWPW